MAGNTLVFKPILGPKDVKLPTYFVLGDYPEHKDAFCYSDDNEGSLSDYWIIDNICKENPDTTFIGFMRSYSSKSCDTTFYNILFNQYGVFVLSEDCPQSGTDIACDSNLIIRYFVTGQFDDQYEYAYSSPFHAKWIGKPRKYYCECSRCGASWNGHYTPKQAKECMPYCSACGAKMDL